MDTTFTIQEAAQRTGVSAHTLRYYERMDLLDAIYRDESGYRQYTAYDLACVEFLTKLRSIKMPIRQMQQFAQLRRQGIATAQQRRVLLEAHYDVVVADQEELNQSLEVIRRKIAYYKELAQRGITTEEEATQIPAYTFMVQAGMRRQNIQISLEPEEAAQTLLHHFDPESLSKLVEILQSKTQAGVGQ
jgi:DNA-binding transcriptional MerR regulator